MIDITEIKTMITGLIILKV